VTIRILHTSDWHLGCPFAWIPADAGAVLRERRLDVIREIAGLARAHRVDAVLVAGDVFDGQHVADTLLDRTLEILTSWSGLWILLPGNHDAARAESVWTRLARRGPPASVRIALERAPIPIAAGRATVLPAPLADRRSPDDPSEWMDDAPSPPEALRIGLAHGVVEGLAASTARVSNPIARDRAVRAGLAYLALGDRHGTLEVAPRTWYAGTPEPDEFRYREAGHVLLVELDGPTAPPRVVPIPTGRFHWVEERLELAPLPAVELSARVEALRRALPAAPERCVLRLVLEGSVDLTGRAAVDEAVARLAAAVRHLDRIDRLALQPTELELAALDDGGPIGVCARRLLDRARRAPSEEERAVAELALRLLRQETDRLTKGGGAGG
jgi:DNA repair exonuclease SbcCD nuclease subunit